MGALMKLMSALVTLLALLQQTSTAPRLQKLVVNVTDSTGRFVLNLQESDFLVEEEGVRQKITSFKQDADTPVSLGILIDKSTSMRLPLHVQGQTPVSAALLAAAGVGRSVVRLMRPQDEFLLMTFDEDLQVKQNFTQDRKKIDDQLYKLNTVGGATHLYDSVVKALEKMEKAKYKRRALLVITDAYDTSGKQLEDLRERIAEHEIQVFSCGLRAVFEDSPDPASEPLFELVLRVLSRDTGGLSMIVDVPELQSTPTIAGVIAFSQLLTLELRGQYTLGYDTDKTGPINSRFIRVRTVDPEFRVRIRRDAEEPPRPR